MAGKNGICLGFLEPLGAPKPRPSQRNKSSPGALAVYWTRRLQEGIKDLTPPCTEPGAKLQRTLPHRGRRADGKFLEYFSAGLPPRRLSKNMKGRAQP